MVDVLTGMRENMKFNFKANIKKETVRFAGYIIINCKTSQRNLTLKKIYSQRGIRKSK